MAHYNSTTRILVVDIETTCSESGIPFEEQVREITEIGITEIIRFPVSRTYAAIKPLSTIYVKNEKIEISDFCTSLTGITQKLLDDQGVSYKDACDIIVNRFDSKNTIWSSWGQFDRIQFERQSRDTGVEYPFSDEHINIKTLYALKMCLPKQISLSKAIAASGREFIGLAHRAKDDAYNTALLLKDLLET